MTTSTSTLLDVVNRVLIDVGERSVTSLTQPFARKAKKYVQDGVREIQRYHLWDWLYSVVTPTTWNGSTAVINNITKILHASWDASGNDTAYDRLVYLDPETFDATIVPDSFDSSTETSTRPRYYTIIERNTIKLNPYPTDASGQAQVKLYVISDMIPPDTDAGVFPLPEDMISILNLYASSKMYLHHLDDQRGAALLKQQFDEQLAYIRVRENKNPGTTLNMYRRNRRY